MSLDNKFSNFYILGDSLSDEGCLAEIMTDIFNNLPKNVKSIANNIFFKHVKNIEDYKYKFTLDSHHYNNASFSNGPTAIKILLDKLNCKTLKPAFGTMDVKFLSVNVNVAKKIGNNFSVAGSVANYYDLEVFSNIDAFTNFIRQPVYIMLKILFNGINAKTTIFNQATSLVEQHNDLSTSLIFVSIGGNDLLNVDLILTKKMTDEHFAAALAYIQKSNNEVKKTLKFLIKNGANNIIVVNSVDVTLLPKNINHTTKALFFYKKLIDEYNTQLQKDILQINKRKKICHLFDLNTYFSKLYKEAVDKNMVVTHGQYKSSGFKIDVNKIDKIITVTRVCKKLDQTKQKDEYVFWDSVHPNYLSHLKTAEEMLKFLNKIKLN